MEKNTCPVDVISMCSAAGDIYPLRLRILDDNRQYIRVDIDEVVCCKKIQYVGNESHVFICKATVHGRAWLFELKYAIRDHNWSLGCTDRSVANRV